MRYRTEEACYEVTADDLLGFRAFLQIQWGVLSAEPFGTTLHVFLDKGVEPSVLEQVSFGSRFRQITPSLEDVFIATVRRDERSKGRAN